MIESTRRWIKPAIVALVVMISYQLFISPIVSDWLLDWQFLHFARMQMIQQQKNGKEIK